MAKQKHVTFGGLGQHEFYMPTTGKGNENRRDRKLCEFYHPETQYCSKIRNRCVGPTICMKYRTRNRSSNNAQKSKNGTGTIVYNEQRGQGIITTISHDICTIQFDSGKKVTAKYPDVLSNGKFQVKGKK